MASKLRAMASNLLAMASNLIGQNIHLIHYSLECHEPPLLDPVLPLEDNSSAINSIGIDQTTHFNRARGPVAQWRPDVQLLASEPINRKWQPMLAWKTMLLCSSTNRIKEGGIRQRSVVVAWRVGQCKVLQL